ncbi:MAG TPA: ubiquinol-cytochrome c reductase iron-sulfur subunit [Acidimicrobiales bacterium]|jgi:cytochrome b6-f complex iron-sulfur subunit|nr:ubiquinol-cytochrome c reductase iron-sulfur subunit [Acidimicrobiales bacterium]
MEGTTILTIAIPVLVALAALVLFTTARRRDQDRTSGGEQAGDDDTRWRSRGREVERAAVLARTSGGTELARAESAPPAAYVPPDEDAIGVTRRQFLNRSTVGMMGFAITGFGASCIAFLWPTLSGGFGSVIRVGTLDDILATIKDTREPFYVPEGRFYLNPYPADAVDAAQRVYPPSVIPGMEAGVIALYQKCPHLGCRVPWCLTSQWFECPCHGSQYNRVGQKKGGPAPRGMDSFPVEVVGGTVSVDTGTVVDGPPIGTNTTGQEAEGPNCVGGSSEH